jgi:hypothetical protein
MSTILPLSSRSVFVRCALAWVASALLLVFCLPVAVHAQTTISTGSIQGSVADATGAVVGNAKITITNKATGQRANFETNSAGNYASGALTPGDYVVRAEAPGFKTTVEPVTVLVGVTASANLKLEIGESSQVVEVQATELQVNTEQVTVQGVLNTEQIENLPINGRNFLDLAQLEPGVQIQDGGNFDPTKNGFSSISFGGRFGRTARIEVDGIDTSDETVGTTTQNIPEGAIQEFQIGQSMLDLSTELTSSGSVNVTTKSGTNSYHGEGYYYFRDQNLDANLPAASHNYFQRNQFGGNFGGALIKNKLFFFLDAERSKQDFVNPVVPGGTFSGLTGSFNSPFRELNGIGRMDYNISNNYKVFYRFSYDQNSDVLAFAPNSFQPFKNVTHTRDHVVGLDFTTGNFTHSVRFGYMKFYNQITAVPAGSVFDPSPLIELAIGSDPNCINNAPDVFCSGQPFLAPQVTPQSDHQIKYDGSKAMGSHIFRYGGGFNHIQGGGFASFLKLGPAVSAGTGACDATCLALPGGDTNPLNYPADTVTLANGQGFSSLKSAFGFPGGGLGPDNRISWYIGDSWKIKPNFTLTYGLRYVRDTGRSDSDTGPLAALNQFGAGLGNPVNNPNKNFAPQLGIAWDPSKSGKTVIRAGIGLFYENSIWNNILFDRPAREPQGLFLAMQPVCSGGAAPPAGVTLPGGTVVNPAFCGLPIGQVQGQIAALQAQYQAAALQAGPQANPVYIGNSLADGINATGTNLFAPNYQTPRSVQMNFGIQHEIRKGMVFTSDYLRNISTHTLLAVDTNHVGDARYLNVNAALAAINATLAANAPGCPAASGAGASSQAAVSCYLATVPTANISDFAGKGLDSGNAFCLGGPCPAAAFGGVNSSLGTNQMLFPIGRSVLNALQLSLKQDVHNPFKGIPYLNLVVSYELSRYVSQAQDSDFINNAWDSNNPGKFIGPDGLDRKHQISFGGIMELPRAFRLGVISHFYSPLPQNLTLQTTGAPGGIFVTDVTGDGTGDGAFANGSNGGFGDILPGTNLGSFGRDVTPSNINNVIAGYNQNFAGKPTPAGQALITANLFTPAQLTSLGAVMPQVSPAPANEAGDAWLRALDLSLNWTYTVKERFAIQPGVTFFNALNFANFDAPKNTLSGVLSTVGTPASVGTANGTPGEQPNNLRVGLGSGVFGLGSPRVIEFNLKFTF